MALATEKVIKGTEAGVAEVKTRKSTETAKIEDYDDTAAHFFIGLAASANMALTHRVMDQLWPEYQRMIRGQVSDAEKYPPGNYPIIEMIAKNAKLSLEDIYVAIKKLSPQAEQELPPTEPALSEKADSAVAPAIETEPPISPSSPEQQASQVESVPPPLPENLPEADFFLSEEQVEVRDSGPETETTIATYDELIDFLTAKINRREPFVVDIYNDKTGNFSRHVGDAYSLFNPDSTLYKTLVELKILTPNQIKNFKPLTGLEEPGDKIGFQDEDARFDRKYTKFSLMSGRVMTAKVMKVKNWSIDWLNIEGVDRDDDPRFIAEEAMVLELPFGRMWSKGKKIVSVRERNFDEQANDDGAFDVLCPQYNERFFEQDEESTESFARKLVIRKALEFPAKLDGSSFDDETQRLKEAHAQVIAHITEALRLMDELQAQRARFPITGKYAIKLERSKLFDQPMRKILEKVSGDCYKFDGTEMPIDILPVLDNYAHAFAGCTLSPEGTYWSTWEQLDENLNNLKTSLERLRTSVDVVSREYVTKLMIDALPKSVWKAEVCRGFFEILGLNIVSGENEFMELLNTTTLDDHLVKYEEITLDGHNAFVAGLIENKKQSKLSKTKKVSKQEAEAIWNASTEPYINRLRKLRDLIEAYIPLTEERLREKVEKTFVKRPNMDQKTISSEKGKMMMQLRQRYTPALSRAWNELVKQFLVEDGVQVALGSDVFASVKQFIEKKHDGGLTDMEEAYVSMLDAVYKQREVEAAFEYESSIWMEVIVNRQDGSHPGDDFDTTIHPVMWDSYSRQVVLAGEDARVRSGRSANDYAATLLS